jgi:hypothetical protein
MDRTELIINCAAILTAVICLLLWLRDKMLSRLAPKDPCYWSGKAFKTEHLRRRIEEVRENPAANLHPNASLSVRRDRISCARRVLKHLAYFRGRDEDVKGSLKD